MLGGQDWCRGRDGGRAEGAESGFGGVRGAAVGGKQGRERGRAVCAMHRVCNGREARQGFEGFGWLAVAAQWRGLAETGCCKQGVGVGAVGVRWRYGCTRVRRVRRLRRMRRAKRRQHCWRVLLGRRRVGSRGFCGSGRRELWKRGTLGMCSICLRCLEISTTRRTPFLQTKQALRA